MTRAVFLLLVCVAAAPAALAQDRGAVEAEFDRLRRDLRIPALSVAVVESGTTVWVRHLGSAPAGGATYPIASLTKPFVSVLAMQLAHAGALKLDAATDGVAPRHLLTHTSTGTPGLRFIYSSQLFAGLEPALEKSAGQPLATALRERVFRAAGLRATSAPARTTAASGLESTVQDLARFAAAVESGPLLPSAARMEMFRAPRRPGGAPLPYAHGWFVQYVGGDEVRWHFGQQDDASSLLLLVPRRRLALAVLARGDRLSAPFWLALGDIRWSPFAAVFLTGWAKTRIDLAEARRAMTQGLIAIHHRRPADAKAQVQKALGLAPALGDAADPALLAAFARAGDGELRAIGRRIAKRLLSVDPDHPRTLFDLAVLQLQDRQPDEARKLLEQAGAGGRATPEIARAIKQLQGEIGR